MVKDLSLQILMPRNPVVAVLLCCLMKRNFFNLSKLSLISITGKDSFDLINRLSTNIINPDQNEVTQTIFTNENGRIIDIVSI